MIYDELIRILNRLLQKPVFKRFPSLREKFYGVVSSYFQRCMVPTQKLVVDIVSAEACYVNTGHPEFITGHRAMAVVAERMAAKKNPPAIMETIQGRPNPKDQQRPPPPTLQQAAALTADPNKDIIDQTNQGFFGSFFNKQQQKGIPGQLSQVLLMLKLGSKCT
jgi:hypothetical protein